MTVDYGAADSTGTKEIAQVALDNPKSDCAGAGVQLEVFTADVDPTPTAKPHGFFIWFYN